MVPVYFAPAAMTCGLWEKMPTMRSGSRKHTVASTAMSASSAQTLTR